MKIVLVEDRGALIDGLRLLLEEGEDLAVIGVKQNQDIGLRVVGPTGQVLLLELRTPHIDPAAVIAQAKAAAPTSRILAVSAGPPAETTLWKLQRSDEVVVLKEATSKRTLAVIRELIEQHDVYVSYSPPSPALRRDPSVELLIRNLRPREMHILELVTAGYSNQRIAETCFLSLHTVRTHVQNILVKLDVHSKLEAALFAVQYGLVLLDGEGELDSLTEPSLGRILP